jgi:ligand-binding SRPBCC domain-containing protein
MSATISVTTRLRATPQQIWRHARTMEGVNEELWPFVRMTVPAHALGRTLEDVALGEPAFTSTMLALQVVPFDRHRLTLVRVERDRGFLERSTSLAQRSWEHERTIAEDGTVTDRVTFATRLPGGERIARPVVRALFRHRHRRLSARFGRP